MTAPPAKPARAQRAADARSVAEATLARVLADDAFAAAALEAELTRAPALSTRDRALATELVYGTLRVFSWAEGQLDRHAKKSVRKLRPRVRAALALAVYQVAFLDRVPSYAAVNEAVRAVRDSSDARVAGFANAILRKVVDALTAAPVTLVDAMASSLAPWLGTKLGDVLGDEGRRAFLAASTTAPPLGLVVPDLARRAAVYEALLPVCDGGSLALGQASPHALVARGVGSPERLVAAAVGDVYVQEEGSQVVALALDARPGERVLDACAGRGHKTRLLAALVGPGGVVDAADLYPAKLDELARSLPDFRGQTFGVDWTAGPGDVPEGYDAVLVDAPCSGVGTLRRRPDLLLRRTEASVAELAALQVAILRQAATRVRVGGRLVYAVCSVLRDEAEDVLAAADLSHFGFRPMPFSGAALTRLFGDASAGRLTPHGHGTDGYFMAIFKRV